MSSELTDTLREISKKYGNVKTIQFYTKLLLSYLEDDVHDAAVVEYLIKLAYELGRRAGKKAGGAGGLIEELALGAYTWLAMRDYSST